MAVSIILIAYLTLCLQHWILYIGSIFLFKQLAYTLYIYVCIFFSLCDYHCTLCESCMRYLWWTDYTLQLSSLSLYIYIYTSTYTIHYSSPLSLYTYIYIYICIEREGRAVMLQRYEIPLMNWLYITALLSLSIHICIHTSTYITINPL